jgi:hypothetical protein
MGNYNFEVRQHAEGDYEYFDTEGGLVWGSGYTTLEQAERQAQWFTDHLNQRDEIMTQVKEKMLPLLEAWDSQTPTPPALDRYAVRLAIRQGVEEALDSRGYPAE